MGSYLNIQHVTNDLTDWPWFGPMIYGSDVAREMRRGEAWHHATGLPGESRANVVCLSTIPMSANVHSPALGGGRAGLAWVLERPKISANIGFIGEVCVFHSNRRSGSGSMTRARRRLFSSELTSYGQSPPRPLEWPGPERRIEAKDLNQPSSFSKSKAALGRAIPRACPRVDHGVRHKLSR